jgi:transcription antitermination factor NusG
MRRWSDRKKKVELPLFSCYVFVKLVPSNSDERMRVYRTNGVFRIVSMRGEAIPIPNEQIEALRTVVTQQVPWAEHPFLKIGQRVRIRGGSLEGVEGVLLSRNGDRTLIISVDAIQRSLAVRVEGYDVEAL